jgi:RNA polymerase sigma-70 factor (ECF subfamily)
VALGDSFDAVLDAARAGGDWAWERIYDDLAPSVLGFLRAGGAPDPEDALGDVFLQVVKGLGRFEGDEPAFRSWVFVIARSRLIDQLRRRGRRPERPVGDEDLEREGNEDVEETVLQSLGADWVMSVLDHLSADQREVILLRILGGLPIAEVARVMHKRPGAVKALQHRALATLRRILESKAVSL